MNEDTFERLQREVGEWSEENFGDQPAHYPFMGTGEEAGELADDLDLSEAPTHEEVDAVGDVLVYAADFCARRGIDLAAAREQARDLDPEHDEFFREWVAARGELERSILKRLQGIDDEDKYESGDRVGDEAERRALSRVLAALESLAHDRGYTLEECAQVVWDEEVSARDWDSDWN